MLSSPSLSSFSSSATPPSSFSPPQTAQKPPRTLANTLRHTVVTCPARSALPVIKAAVYHRECIQSNKCYLAFAYPRSSFIEAQQRHLLLSVLVRRKCSLSLHRHHASKLNRGGAHSPSLRQFLTSSFDSIHLPPLSCRFPFCLTSISVCLSLHATDAAILTLPFHQLLSVISCTHPCLTAVILKRHSHWRYHRGQKALSRTRRIIALARSSSYVLPYGSPVKCL